MRHVFTLDSPPPKNLKGQDLRDSYFGGTLETPLNIRRIDLTGCDLTNVTFVFCDGREAKMGDAKCYGVYCRHSRWEGAQVPAETGFLQHEWVAEIIRTGAEDESHIGAKQHFEGVAAFVLGAYTPQRSWNTSWEQFTPTEEIKTRWRTLFASYPFLARRFERLVEKFDVSRRPH